MKIKKLGHCCLLIHINGITVLTDPGTFSTMQDSVTGVDIILITHEHQDHLHIDSLKKIISNNPNAAIITNSSVGALLDREGIKYKIIAGGDSDTGHGLLIEGYGSLHAEIYGDWGQVENTGYFLGGVLFYPGDAFTDPQRPIDVLALPVAGPWMRLHDAMDYCLAVKPRIAFPVHDGILKTPSMVHKLPSTLLADNGIRFVAMEEGSEAEFDAPMS